MKTIIKLMLAITILSISCSEDKPTDKQEPKIINAEITETSYFPLSVGNEWVYEVSRDTARYYIKIIEKKIINNNEYYVISFTPEMGGHIFKDGRALIRISEDLKLIKYDEGEEKLYRDFSYTLTDSNYNKEFETSNTSYIDLPIGRFNDCKMITNYRDMEPSFWFYAKGIGLIQYVWFRGEYHLISAKINNRNY